MKINHRHYTLIVFALATTSLVFMGYVFIYKNTIKQAEYYINATKEVESQNNKKQYEKKLLGIFDISVNKRQKIESLLVHEDKVVNFIEEVETVGVNSKTALELSSIENSDGKIKAKVEVKGSWANVITALMLLENLPFGSSIGNIALMVGDTTTVKNPLWGLSLDIEALTIK